MKKIAYIELDTHAEIALNFMELMSDSQKFSVDYYLSDKILKSLDLQENKNIFKATPTQLHSQISRQPYDLVIIGTVHRYFNVFDEITKYYNTAIICHNLNFVNVTNWKLWTAIFKEDVAFRIKLLLKEGLLRKSKVYEKAKHFLVLDHALISFFQTKDTRLNKKTFNYLPVFYTKFLEKYENEIFTLVIPGAVSQKRRDYESVIEKLKNLKFNCQNETERRSREISLQVIFLGKAQGKELQLLQDFEKNQPKNIRIKYFTEKVPQPVFDEYMKKADLLWCPVQQLTEFFSQKEIYGKTKMSGNIGDAIKFGKHALFPENYSTNLPFIIPQKGDLSDVLLSENNADFKNFQKVMIAQKLEKILESIS